MKKLFLTSLLVSILAVFTLSLPTRAVAQQIENRYWTVNLSEPQTVQNSKTFNLDYQVASTEDDSFTVDLYQNSVLAQTENLTSPNSGRFEVTVPSDGTYSYYISVYNVDADETKESTPAVTTQVVTTIPDSVIYSGKTVNGNTVTVNFTVPAGSSIVNVNIYGSTATTFALDNSTLLASVVATPGVAQVANFVSTLAANLNIAVVGFDVAGNQSAPVGDSNIRFSGNTATTNTSQGGALGGAEPTITETSSSTNDGQTLTEVGGTAAEGQGLAGWKIALIAVAAVIVAGAAGWYAYYRAKLNKEDN